MERKKVTIKGVDPEAWDILRHLRELEQRFNGAIISDCIRAYWENSYEHE